MPMKPVQCLDIDSEDDEFDGKTPEVVEEEKSAPSKEWEAADEVAPTDEEDWDDYYDEIEDLMPGTKTYGGVYAHREVGQRTAAVLKLASKINVEPLPSHKISHAGTNSMVSAIKKNDAPKNLGLTKDDRATVEQVLDPRTMLVLSGMMKRGMFDSIAGCISTGKEANVYHATSTIDPTVWTTTRNPHIRPDSAEEGKTWELAVKVYKTSVLVFKDRARYVEGEFRFRRGGYQSGNPRKMVAQWAEKELRNLKRIKQFIPCPDVYEVRQNVLVMGFLGKDGDAAPRLKDVRWLEQEQWQEVYIQMCLMMRTMTQKCKLVHGDLSEYNLLWHNSQIYMIDVSQSVEYDHPHALDFLKRDVVNVNRFFESCGCLTVDVKTLFDYIISEQLSKNEEDEITDLLEKAEERGADYERTMEEEVFLNTWIPSHLGQMSDLKEIDKELGKRERGEEVLYERFLKSGKVVDKNAVSEDEKSDEEEEIQDDGSESDGSVDSATQDILAGHKPEHVSKAEWKKMVKEANREKRKQKVPKHVKKKKEKKHR